MSRKGSFSTQIWSMELFFKEPRWKKRRVHRAAELESINLSDDGDVRVIWRVEKVIKVRCVASGWCEASGHIMISHLRKYRWSKWEIKFEFVIVFFSFYVLIIRIWDYAQNYHHHWIPGMMTKIMIQVFILKSVYTNHFMNISFRATKRLCELEERHTSCCPLKSV